MNIVFFNVGGAKWMACAFEKRREGYKKTKKKSNDGFLIDI